MTRQTILVLLAVLAVLGLAGVAYSVYDNKSEVHIVNTFDECVDAGFPVQESHPARCTTADGRTFVETVEEEPAPGETPDGEDEDPLADTMIIVDTPLMNATVSSPLHVEGQARGNWYFEASFPVELRDSNDNVLATGIAQAQGEWMTTNFVPFELDLTFTSPGAGTTGTLVLMKDNPSGEPQFDDELVIPVVFN